MNRSNHVFRLAASALLVAIGILIPVISPVKIPIGPAGSMTLASHVAIFLAMYLSPLTAGAVAIGCAAALRRALREKGYAEHIAAPTNQIFVRMTREKYEQLRSSVAFSFWEPLDAEMCVVRFVTSWATRPEDVEQLCALL